jgi:hypothetical protein
LGNGYCRCCPPGARRRLLSDPKFCVWLNRLPAIPISHQQDRYFVSSRHVNWPRGVIASQQRNTARLSGSGQTQSNYPMTTIRGVVSE